MVEVGAEPIALVHRDDKATDVPAEHRVVDLLDPRGVAEAIDGVDLVVHLAARSGGIQFQHGEQRHVLQDNTSMTRNVLDGAIAALTRRVFLASSGVVYSRFAGELLGEDSPVLSPAREPVTGYAWSKLTDEVLGRWVASENDIEVVAGRFTNVYGPGGSFDPDRSTVVHALVKKAADAAPDGVLEVWGDGSPVRNFVFVEDAARAVMTVLASGDPGEVYNISAGDQVSIAELAEEVRTQVSPELEIVFDRDRPQGPQRRVLDAGKLEELGFAASVALPEGIARTLAAYRSA